MKRLHPLFANLLGMLLATAGWAQAPTGNLFGTVEDTDGAPLPGVTVTLSGVGAEKTQITDSRGQFRFLSLDPGRYQLDAKLEGFGSVTFPDIDVRVNRNTTVPLVLTPAVEETITVTSESPLLDERKLQQGTTVSQIELEKIPTARDPWAILNQTPGVLVDRVNVGGNESGQQSIFRAQGVLSDENDFLVDGVQITDMRAVGASSTYYDFDQFAEMQFTTGGTDVTKNSSGVSVNLVTKRGTNEFRGSARFNNTKASGYFNGALDQARPDVSQSDLAPGQFLPETAPPGTPDSNIFKGAEIREIEEIGFEAGGAVVRDRLWLWGAWGQNDVQQNAASGTADDTILENASLKLNAQFSQANSAVGSWNNGDKQKFGRGAGIQRPDETTWNQRGPTAIYRFEDTHVVSSNLFVTGTFSHLDAGFALAARGGVGPDAPEAWRDSSGVWHDSFLSGAAQNPADEYKADVSYFFNTGSVSHELKVGGRFREFDSQSAFAWPGRNLFTDNGNGRNTLVIARRGVATPVGMDYVSFWAQDTLSSGRLTVNVGFRYDDQSGVNEPFTVPANPFVPELLPAIDFPGFGEEFSWTDVTPRVGVTYALGKDRDTLVRASFSQFADQLDVGTVNRTNPAGTAYAIFLAPEFLDGPFQGEASELRFLVPSGFDPANPTSLESPDVTSRDLDAPLTNELVVNVEHALLPEFVIGLSGTYRLIDDILETRDFVRDASGAVRTVRRDDFVPDGSRALTLIGGLSGGPQRTVTTPFFALDPSLTLNGGSLLLNGSRQREYLGGALTFTKRLANQWMLRGFFNFGEAEWDVDDEFLRNADPNRSPGGGDRDGDLFVERSTGSGKGERFLQSSWSFNLNGMYQFFPGRPYGFNVSGSVQGREGYPIPYLFNLVGSDGVSRDVGVLDDLDDYRLDDLVTLDLRIEKEFALSSAVNFTAGLDVFNITNEGTELSRERDLSSGQAFFLGDNISPRIYRLGVRLSWK